MAIGRPPYQDFVSFYTAFFEDVKWGRHRIQRKKQIQAEDQQTFI